MKVVRQLLRAKLLEKIPTLARIDRFNQQYNNLDQDDLPDYENGVVYIEVLPVQWEQLGSDKIQEADATIWTCNKKVDSRLSYAAIFRVCNWFEYSIGVM
jgi:hypothetical protein